MFSLSMPELMIVFVAALVLLGPEQLPTVAKSLGKMMRSFNKAANDIRDTIDSEVNAINPLSTKKKDDNPLTTESENEDPQKSEN
jgi:Tat protein translocase TatB subunit